MAQAARKPRAASKTSASVKVDVRIESDLWKGDPEITTVARRAIVRAAAVVARPKCELSVLLTDDPTIRMLNCDWRGVDAPTNVFRRRAPAATGHSSAILSWPMRRLRPRLGRSTSRLPITLPIFACTASCIFWDMITRARRMRRSWKRRNGTFCGGFGSRTPTARARWL